MQSAVNTSTVAVFDLDGTLTWKDTLLPFLVEYLGTRPARLARLWRLPGALAAYAAGGADRGLLKARLIHIALDADPRADIEAWAGSFVAAMPSRGFFRPQALAALEDHRRAGDRLVLLSASPDLYVPLIGQQLGFAQTICTELNWRGDRVEATLRSANRLGVEKLRVLESLRRLYPDRRFVAYGNSATDLVHLHAADQGVLVNATRSARAQALRLGIATSDWR